MTNFKQELTTLYNAMYLALVNAKTLEEKRILAKKFDHDKICLKIKWGCL